jgi:hypothetical protein
MVFGPHVIGDYLTESDFYGDYAQGARLVQHGHLIPARYGVVGPVYEIALALAGFAIPDLFRAAQLLSVAATLAVLLLWFALLRRRADGRLALFAVLFLATNPVLFLFGYSATTDALALALQSAALTLLLARAGDRAALAAGALAALATLTRYNAVYLVPGGLLAILGGGTLQPRRARAAWLAAAGYAAVIAPWTLFCIAHGTWPGSQLHHNVAYEVFARARGITWDEYQRTLQPGFHGLMDVIRRDPGAVARRLLFNLGDHLRLDAAVLLGWPVAAAALLGAALGLRDGTLRKLWPLPAAGALAYLALLPVFHSERYALPLLPVYATLAACLGAARPWGRLRGRAPWLGPALAALPLVLSVASCVEQQRSALSRLPTDVLECAPTLRRLRRPGDRVIARKAQIAYYGGVEGRSFPFATDLPALARYAREQRARWLYLSWVEAELRPQFWYLLDTSAVVPGLAPRQVSRGNAAVLYEIGPDFGRVPAWYADETLRTVHLQRGLLQVRGRSVSLLYSVAQAEVQAGHTTDARAHLERAAQLAPDDRDVWLALGGVALAAGDPSGAGSAFRHVLTLDPASTRAQIGLGLAALAAGQVPEAAAAWRPVVTLVGDPALLARMAQVFHATGDREAERQALAALSRARGGP